MHRCTAAIILAPLIMATAAFATPVEIQRVTVRDAEFKIVIVIFSKVELEKFHQQWSHKAQTGKTGQHPDVHISVFTHRLDIESQSRSTRWLYDPSGGVISVLSKAVQPVFKVEDPEAFNQLLGIRPR